MPQINAMVACSDLAGYARATRHLPEEEVFRLLSGYYEFLGQHIEAAEGQVIKFMGDAALLLFPEDSVDAGVQCLLELQREGDAYLAQHGLNCRHQIKAHFGSVMVGPLGTRGDMRTDVVGATVNAMFLLKSTGFAITPQLFRQLEPPTRKAFKKHTPPVTYFPTTQPHTD